MFAAHAALLPIFRRGLTLDGPWRSQYRFPFVSVGERGVFNTTPDLAVLGVEVRPIPQDDLAALLAQVRAVCADTALELSVLVSEAGVACDLDNPYLATLLQALRAFGAAPVLGKKLPGSSARFAPRGQGIVWGQSGIGPHAAGERHFVPSIEPYYRALAEFGRLLRGPA
jgi:acetylornithine deacetylase/succinyl-diaminopimelate desuccinylase-like protein